MKKQVFGKWNIFLYIVYMKEEKIDKKNLEEKRKSKSSNNVWILLFFIIF